VKKIKATPMTLGEYWLHTDNAPDDGENPADEGYLMTHSDGDECWHSKKHFEAAYLEVPDEGPITPHTVNGFVGDVRATVIDEQTVTVTTVSRAGHHYHETARVDLEGADLNIVAEYANQANLNEMHQNLLFVQKWADNGLGAALELSDGGIITPDQIVESAGVNPKLILRN
jgi:hypothetical protein